jgi:argininosuccinate lyase
MTLWSGRFSSPMAASLWDLSESYSFDHVLYAHDIVGSKAHVRGLEAVGLLTNEECALLLDTLDTINEEFESGAFVRLESDEDIHMAIERRATELAGPTGAKIHTARSRNDQVATTLRLFTRDAVSLVAQKVLELVDALSEVGAKYPHACFLRTTLTRTRGPYCATWTVSSTRESA